MICSCDNTVRVLLLDEIAFIFNIQLPNLELVRRHLLDCEFIRRLFLRAQKQIENRQDKIETAKTNYCMYNSIWNLEIQIPSARQRHSAYYPEKHLKAGGSHLHIPENHCAISADR